MDVQLQGHQARKQRVEVISGQRQTHAVVTFQAMKVVQRQPQRKGGQQNENEHVETHTWSVPQQERGQCGRCK
jgi:hypothetical protein